MGKESSDTRETYMIYDKITNNGDNSSPVSIEDAPDDRIDWDKKSEQKRRQAWESRPMVSNPEIILQQPGINTSPMYLFPICIPDKANKQDQFQNPHPQAPKMYMEAMRHGDSQVWKEVTAIELDVMQQLGVWEVVPRSQAPLAVKPLPWKWVYTY